MVESGKGSSTSFITLVGKANSFLFEKNKKVMYFVSPIVIIILTFAVFSWEASDKADLILGADAIDDIIKGTGSNNFDPGVLDDYTEQVSVSNSAGDLDEGVSVDLKLESSEHRLIKQIDIDLQWDDESDPPGIRLRNYQNQPDTFSVSISHPDGNTTVLGESDSGSLTGSVSFSDQDIERLFGMGNFTVTIKLVTTGDWEANLGLGFFNMPDTGNSYTMEINEVFLAPEETE
jgi:hypothetical protein